MSMDEIEELQNKKEMAILIIRDINDQKIQIKVLNYIAPHFQLKSENNKNLILFDDEMSDSE
jgi:hypothetical protein